LTIFSRSVLHIKFKQQVTVFALQQSKLSQVTVPAKLLFVVKYYAKLEVSRNAISGSFSTRAGRCVTPYQPGAEGSILLLIPLYLFTSRWCRTFGEIRSSKRLVSTKRVQ